MSAPKIMVIYGTRPEAIKVAPVILALDASDRLECVPVVTGQHREVLDQVNHLFGLTPQYDLDVLAPGQSLSELVAKALARLDPILREVAPDAVLVQGDTSTALAGALAGFHRTTPVVHLEAGLRSGNLASPFPEEANRRLITQLASLHLAPTGEARRNLQRDGVASDSIVVTGNTVIDALHWVVARNEPFGDDRLRAIEESGRRVMLVTVHRRENWGAPLDSIARALRRVALAFPELRVVLPVHPNPLVRDALVPVLGELANVLITEPMAYSDFARAMKLAHLVVSDSGGVQEEAPSLGKPVLVLRDNTERPEAVEAGTVRLVGIQEQRIVDEVERLLCDRAHYVTMANAVNPYGDGAAAERSVAALAELLRAGKRLADFRPRDLTARAPLNSRRGDAP